MRIAIQLLTLFLISGPVFAGGLENIPIWDLRPPQRTMSAKDAALASIKIAHDFLEVLKEYQQEKVLQPELCKSHKDDSLGCAVTKWRKLRGELQFLPRREQVEKVNQYFNQVPYQLNQKVWGIDMWVPPLDFMARNAGDCKEYAISKYLMLRELGFHPEELWLLQVLLVEQKIGHLVLIVNLEGRSHVLDNRVGLEKEVWKRPSISIFNEEEFRVSIYSKGIRNQ